MTTPQIPRLPKVTLWLNAACSKSRRAKELLELLRVDVEEFHYLETPPSREQLRTVLSLLGKTPRELVRRGESVFEELGLQDAADERLLDAMVKHPVLIQRPIAVVADRGVAVIARPPELAVQVLAPPLPPGTSPNTMVRRMMQGKIPFDDTSGLER